VVAVQQEYIQVNQEDRVMDKFVEWFCELCHSTAIIRLSKPDGAHYYCMKCGRAESDKMQVRNG
jgi:predicted RNA-binding Zn-ribbon protein involved in translation (DUF1610 family)